MMNLRVNQIAFGLGEGVLGASPCRMGVWTQGCSLRKCPGCSSRHTWARTGGIVVGTDALLRLAQRQATPPSGLTVSGGEPTDQAEGVTALMSGFRTVFLGAEVILYTGLSWPDLAERHPALVALLDVAVTGPFQREREATALAGSDNQELVLLTPLARRLYCNWRAWPRHVLQVGQSAGEQLVTVGIPDTARMDHAAEQIGATATTWRRALGATARRQAE